MRCFFVLCVVFVAVVSMPAWAKYHALDNAEIAALAEGGKTFLSYDRYVEFDRFYMSENGRFIQQINGTWDKPHPPQTFAGVWMAKDNQLCWQYTTTPTGWFERYNTQEYCYNVYRTETTALPGIPEGNMANIVLGRYNANNQFVKAFDWKVFSRGPYIYTDPFLKTLQKAMDTMQKQYESIQKDGIASMPGAQVNRSDVPPAMHRFYDKMIGQIAKTTDDYVYYHPDGRFVITTAEAVAQFLETGDQALFVKTLGKGQWRFFDDYYCRQMDMGGVVCEYIVAKIGLTQPYRGFLGHFYPTRFPRFHHKPVVEYIDPAKKPSLYAVFEAILTE